MGLQIAGLLDLFPHEILPAGSGLGELPNVIVRTVRALAPAVVDPWQPHAQPVIAVHECKVLLQPSVDPQPAQLRRFVVLVVVVDRGGGETDPGAAKVDDVRHADDQQPVEVRIIGKMLEQRTAIGADMADLYRADAGQCLKTGLVGVEQYPAIADDRDLAAVGGTARFCPGLRAVVDVAGAQT